MIEPPFSQEFVNRFVKMLCTQRVKDALRTADVNKFIGMYISYNITKKRSIIRI